MKWTFLLAFGGIGLTCLIAGVIWGSRRYTLWHEGLRVTGTVVDIYESHSTHTENGRTTSSTSYYPIAEFASQDGKTHRFKGSTGLSSPDFEIGDKREIIYNPLDPAGAQFSSFTQFWLGPLGIGVFGLVFFVAGVGSFFFVRNSDRTFGPEFHQKMDRAELYTGKHGIKLAGTVREVRAAATSAGTRYTVVCEGGAPGGAPREFLAAPLAFDPGQPIIGKAVEIYADPLDPERYYVRLEPLFEAAPPGGEWTSH